MSDHREIYFHKWRAFIPKGGIAHAMEGLCISEVDIYNKALQLANAEIEKTMPRYVGELQCKYKPNMAYMAPFIEKICAQYGITSTIQTCGDNKERCILTIHFTHMPDIVVKYIFVQHKNARIGRACLHKQLAHKYFTPYVEEAFILKYVFEVLPQPIAEEITSCVMGVIARRIIAKQPFMINWEDAWEQEVILTYVDMFGKWPNNMLIPNGDSWESTAITMRLEEGYA